LSYRISQLSPQSTRGLKVSVQGPWSNRPEKFRDMEFLRSWMEFDSDFIDRRLSPAGVNWSAVMGIGAMFLVSAAFWTGVGFAVARLVN